LNRRRGFTLIELLVVIGIILVLVAIVVMGIRHTSYLAAKHETQAEMKICQDMLAEYKAVNGYKNILGDAGTASTNQPLQLPYPPWLIHSFNVPVYVYPTKSGFGEITANITNPVSTLHTSNLAGSPNNKASSGYAGDFGDKSDPNCPRWASDAVHWTQAVMFILLKDPKNRAVVSSLPPKRVLEGMPAPVNNSGVIIGKVPPSYTIDAAVPLDAWGNPIIFVPPGGVYVSMNPDGSGFRDFVIRTSGTYDTNVNVPPVSANDHPFFASAGADGFFTDLTQKFDRASDNVYSFQEQ
jgi:prepilin-type N-terminal cleavage/methylation domain-containing protein